MKDIVFQICSAMLDASPERSYKRLNPALRSTLANCIEADLPFLPDTFRRIYNKLRGHWWFGDGSGSHIGEHFYSLACDLNHASAQQSFETFAGRPGCLWGENAKTPERLHVGSRFTWKGYYVEVASLRKDSLVACTYHDSKQSVYGIKVGAEIGGDYVVTHSKKTGAELALRAVKVTARNGDRVVARRFTITYQEIAEFRRTEARRVKVIIAKIEKLNPKKDGPKLSKEINSQHFRHFQLEILNKAFRARIKKLEESKAARANLKADKKRQSELEELHRTEPSRIESWRNGNGGAWLNARGTFVRPKGDLVECSNGNSVSRAAVVRALPVIMARRKDFGSLSLPLDGHSVNRLDEQGVTVGCTVIPWPEVDRLKSVLGQ